MLKKSSFYRKSLLSCSFLLYPTHTMTLMLSQDMISMFIVPCRCRWPLAGYYSLSGWTWLQRRPAERRTEGSSRSSASCFDWVLRHCTPGMFWWGCSSHPWYSPLPTGNKCTCNRISTFVRAFSDYCVYLCHHFRTCPIDRCWLAVWKSISQYLKCH